MSGDATLDVGLQLFPGAPAGAVDEAQAAEALGFDSVWVADHFHGAGREVDWVVPECVAVLGAMAARTSRVRLGTCVASTTKRDPAQLAHAALTLSAISGGRFNLGLGTGFGPDLRAFGVTASKPAQRLERSLDVLEGLWGSGPDRPFAGTWEDRTFDGAFLNLPGVSRPPILLAALGPRLLRLTAERADGWLPYGLTPDIYREFLARMPGRRATFQPKLWLPTFLERPGEDCTAEAEATGRLYLSMAPAVLEATLDQTDVTLDVPTSLDWTPAAAREIAARIPRELALSVVLHGSPERCLETLLRFAQAGCQEVVLRITEVDRRGDDAVLISREILEPLRADAGSSISLEAER